MNKFSEDTSKGVVYNIPWQVLRIQMIQKYSEKGGFDTVEGVRENIAKMKDYLGKMTDINKVYRVLNLVNAVRMGYAGLDEVGTDKDKALTPFWKAVNESYHKLKDEGNELTVDDPEDIKKDLKKADPYYLDLAYRDLKKRYDATSEDVEKPFLEKILNLTEKHLTTVDVPKKEDKKEDQEVDTKEKKEKESKVSLTFELKKMAIELEEFEGTPKEAQGDKLLAVLLEESSTLLNETLKDLSKVKIESLKKIFELLDLDKDPKGKVLYEKLQVAE